MAEKNEPHQAAAHPKVYDGSRVVAHPVKAGETLTSIAAAYLMKDWKPLWIYNSQVRKTVGDDPDLIRRGVTIFIPRSPNGYAKLIKNLKVARLEAEYLGDSIRLGLEADADELAAFKGKIDLAGDIALTFASLGLKAAAAAKASKAVEVAKGQAKIAQQLSANATTREFAEGFAKFRSKYVAEALKQNKAMLGARDAFMHKAGQKLVGAGAELADRRVKDAAGQDAAWFKKTYKAMTTAEKIGKAWKEATHAAMTGSFLLVALDYLKPSEAAEALIFCMTGETVGGAQAKAAQGAAASTTRALARIDEQIAKARAECELLYG